MKTNNKLVIRLIFTCLLTGIIKLNAQLTTIGIGNYTVGGVSNNGIVSLHQSGAIFKWDAANGLMQIGSISNGYTAAGLPTITSDGTKISASVTNTANNFNEIASYNISTSAWSYLGGLVNSGWDGYISSSWGMTSDGSKIVGLAMVTAGNGNAVKWDAVNGMQDLGTLVVGRSSRANAVNVDGSVIVGWQDDISGSRQGVKWVNGVESFILDNTGNNVGEAGAVSEDGNVVIGYASPNPYVLIGNNLTYITHPYASDFFKGGATAISGDGQKVIGYFRGWPGAPYGGEGFIWTAADGRINLNDYATSLGINTQGVIMSLPLAISKDGTKISGMGRDANNQAIAFYLDLRTYLSTKENTEKLSEQFTFYPNPTKDYINIKGYKDLENIEIYNMVGQKIMIMNSVNNKIDVSSLLEGTYLLKYSIKGESKTYKFIKQ